MWWWSNGRHILLVWHTYNASHFKKKWNQLRSLNVRIPYLDNESFFEWHGKLTLTLGSRIFFAEALLNLTQKKPHKRYRFLLGENAKNWEDLESAQKILKFVICHTFMWQLCCQIIEGTAPKKSLNFEVNRGREMTPKLFGLKIFPLSTYGNLTL